MFHRSSPYATIRLFSYPVFRGCPPVLGVGRFLKSEEIEKATIDSVASVFILG